MRRMTGWAAALLALVEALLIAALLPWLKVAPWTVWVLRLLPPLLAGVALLAVMEWVERTTVQPLRGAMRRAVRRAEAQTSRLASEQERLVAVLEHLADALLIADGQGRVRLLNPAAARLFGVEEAGALGRPLSYVVRDHRIVALWERCRESGEEQAEPLEGGRLGENRFLQVIVTPLEGLAEPAATLLILQDLTRIRRLETVRRDFISNISHELRTPLTSLKALVETLRDGAMDDPPAARHFLTRMEEEVDALAQMVEELLELSRIESGQVPLRLRPTPVETIVRPPVERLRLQAERKGLRLTTDLPPDLPLVLADAQRMQRVIGNLVHNAIKFTPQGGVEVGASLQGEEVVITVRDSGVGIPAEVLPRIFERFYKADRARSGGGTGLGLAIAKHLVLAHNGRIWAESREGEGSAFHVALPVA